MTVFNAGDIIEAADGREYQIAAVCGADDRPIARWHMKHLKPAGLHYHAVLQGGKTEMYRIDAETLVSEIMWELKFKDDEA